jgi:hypothetical protein
VEYPTGYRYVRLEPIAGQPGSSVLSGLIFNYTLAPNNLVLQVCFSSFSGTFATSQFNMAQGSIVAFSLVVPIPFNGAHSGTLMVTGPGGSDTSPFISDPATEGLGFQNVIVGHAMPDVVYPNTPSSQYPLQDVPPS